MTEIKPADNADLMHIAKNIRFYIEKSPAGGIVGHDTDGCYAMLLYLSDHGALYVFVAVEKTIVGWAGLLVSPNVYAPGETLGDIYFIDVSPEHRREGIAGKLIAAIEQKAKELGLSAITVSFTDKFIAERVAHKMGYKLTEYKLIKKVGSKWPLVQ